MHNRIDWEDLRFVLAVAEAKSLAAAARALGVNHTTVLRRVSAFEQRLGVRVFDRLPSGYTLTAAGEEALSVARGLSEAVDALERKLAGQDLRLQGVLRVTTTDTLMASVLPRLFAGFRERHPGIGLEVTTASAMANLSRRDADVAIRPAADPPEMLVGRKVCDVAFAAYASRSYLEKAGRETPFRRLRWVAPDDSLADSAAARWLRSTLPDAVIALHADSLTGLAQAAAAGLGAAALPCYLGDSTPGLVRLGPPLEALRTALWVLTHADLRRTARVSAFMEFAASALQKDRDLLEGNRPRPAAPGSLE